MAGLKCKSERNFILRPKNLAKNCNVADMIIKWHSGYITLTHDTLTITFLFRPCVQAATKLLDEMCHLTAQSLTAMDTSEHFKVLKLLGEGSYGKVMLAVHRKRGEGGREGTNTWKPLDIKIQHTTISFPCILQVRRWPWSSSPVSPRLSSLSWGSTTSLCRSVPTRPSPELWESPTPHLRTTSSLSKRASLATSTTSSCPRYAAISAVLVWSVLWYNTYWGHRDFCVQVSQDLMNHKV